MLTDRKIRGIWGKRELSLSYHILCHEELSKSLFPRKIKRDTRGFDFSYRGSS